MELSQDTDLAKTPEKIVIELQNQDLWNNFHKNETEMIVTKNGRRMFPFVRLNISGLDPTKYYSVLLEFKPVSNSRFKYYGSTGWTSSVSEEEHSGVRIYLHPESPATGDHWMSRTLSFGRVKLTNTAVSRPGLIGLSSMHKYQPVVTLVQYLDPSTREWVRTTTVLFPETQFITVTAYQNEEVTKLKIEHNPFAKGFRETGQAKYKRKRPIKEECDKKENSDSSSSSKSTSSSSWTDNLQSRFMESYLPQVQVPSHYPIYYSQYPYIPHNFSISPYYLSNNFYYNTYNTNWNHHSEPPTNSQSEVPKKLTDFSIRAITGL